jgi:hypothetical protein
MTELVTSFLLLFNVLLVFQRKKSPISDLNLDPDRLKVFDILADPDPQHWHYVDLFLRAVGQ